VHVEAGRHLYGGALQVLLLLRGLSGGAGRHVLACPAGSELARAAGPHVDRLVELPMGGDLDVSLTWRLRRLLEDEHADLLHVHSRRGVDYWGGLAARWAGVPAILTRRVDNPEPRWLASRKYALYRRVVVISDGIRPVLVAAGVPPDRITRIPSAVDAALYQGPCDRAALARELGFPKDAVVAAVVAQFIHRKGHDVLLAALDRIRARAPDLHVLLFGRGPLVPRILRGISERGLEDRVQYSGFRDDLHRILPCMDMLIHPARMEGLGVSLLQASAAGVPVVATRVGGIPEAVVDGQTGLLVPPDDGRALGAAILRLYGDPQLRAEQSRRGIEHVQNAFSVTAMSGAYRSLYEAVLASGVPEP
jgi:glycosyltransferase involved in cell wall biosynthesis